MMTDLRLRYTRFVMCSKILRSNSRCPSALLVVDVVKTRSQRSQSWRRRVCVTSDRETAPPSRSTVKASRTPTSSSVSLLKKRYFVFLLLLRPLFFFCILSFHTPELQVADIVDNVESQTLSVILILINILIWRMISSPNSNLSYKEEKHVLVQCSLSG